MTADVLRIGPLVMSWSVLLALACTMAGITLATRLARRAGLDLGRLPETAAVIGFVAARLGFVWQFAAAYLAQPWTLLDLRDGGWEPTVGFAAAWLYGLSRSTRWPAAGRPLRWGLAAATGVWLAGTGALQLAAPTGAQRPPLILTALDDGADVPLAGFAGRPLVLNLWATWCPPCVREMPVLAAAQQRERGIVFVFVNQGEGAPRVERFVTERKLALDNLLLDPGGELARAVGSRAMPTTLFYDAQGRLVDTHLGAVSDASLEAKLGRIRSGASR